MDLTNEAANRDPGGGAAGEVYVLRLYVAGGTELSAWAIHNMRRLCEEHLEGRFDLAVIDVRQQPLLASAAQLVATPTLVKELPLPLQRFIGTMSDFGVILAGLGVHPGRPVP